VERVIEQEIETLRTLANEFEKDFSVLLLKGVDKDEIQKIKTRIKKHIVSLQMIITDLKTDLDFIGEWRKND